MVNMMERAFTNWGVAVDIEVNTLMDKNMAKVCSSGQTDVNMKEGGSWARWMVRVPTPLRKVKLK